MHIKLYYSNMFITICYNPEPVVQASGSLTLGGTFTPSLMDPNSQDYMELEQSVVASVSVLKILTVMRFNGS